MNQFVKILDIYKYFLDKFLDLFKSEEFTLEKIF